MKQKRLIRKITTIFMLTLLFGSMLFIFNPSIENVEAKSWWNTNWQSRMLITIDSTKIDSTLTDFPVMIYIESDTNLSKYAQSDGDDICFIDYTDNDTKWSHEIEYFNSATGELVAWVEIPTLSHTDDTKFHLYYNNSWSSNQQDPAGTWSNGFSAVFHLNESYSTDTDHYKDSSAYNNHGTMSDNVAEDPYRDVGKIGYACNFSNADDGILLPIIDENIPITVSCWVRTEAWWKNTDPKTYDGYYDNRGIVSRYYIDDGIRTGTATNGSIYSRFQINGTDETGYNEAPAKAGFWYYATIIVEHDKIWYMINDTIYTTDNIDDLNDKLDHSSLYHWAIGSSSTWTDSISTGACFNGTIDEARIVNASRSTDWVNTSYKNQNDPDSFYTIDDMENGGGDPNYEPLLTNPTPVNGASGQEMSVELGITVNDPEGHNMNVSFYYKKPNEAWLHGNTTYNVPNGTYTWNLTDLITDSTIYWSANVTDMNNWTNITYTFTTFDDFTLKWDIDNNLWTTLVVSPVARDVNGDGHMEIFFQGYADPVVTGSVGNVVVCLNGTDGSTNWYYVIDTFAGNNIAHGVGSLADLDMDGTIEYVINGGWNTYAFNCEDGTIFWNSTTNSGWSGHAVVYDERVNHYWIYQPSISAYSDNRLYRINGTNGVADLYTSNDHGQSCNGGIAYDDIDRDGMIEIVATGSQGDGDLNGIKIYDLDLNIEAVLPWWEQTSHTPMLADVTGNADLEIISPMNDFGVTNDGRIYIYYADGTEYLNITANICAHDESSIWQNKSGDWLFNTKRSHNYGIYYNKVWNLTGNKQEKLWSPDDEYGLIFKADLYPHNGNDYEYLYPSAWSDAHGTLYSMEDYSEIVEVAELFAGAPLIGDIDGDGYTEVVCVHNNGEIVCFDTGTQMQTQLHTWTEQNGYRRTNSYDHYEVPWVHQARFSNQVPAHQSVNVSTATASFTVDVNDPLGHTFNWTIETYPDVGSASANGENNGTKSCSLSGLGSGVVYTVYVNVTDGNYTRWQIYNFTTEFTPEYKDDYIYPNLNGYENENAVYGDTPAWKCVDEVAFDGDSTFIYSSHVQYLYDYFNLENMSAYGTINHITIEIVARDELNSVAGRIRDVYRTYDTNYINATAIVVTSNYGTYSFNYPTNPSTGLAWTWDEIDDLQAGVGLYGKTGANQIRCGRIRVKINYTTYPYIDTLNAEGIEENNATLVGNITEDGGYTYVKTYFEWGQSTNYGNSTGYNYVQEGNFTKVNISGLRPGINYHYRAVFVDLNDNLYYGDDVNFTTKPEAPMNLTAELRNEGTAVYLEWTNGDGRHKTVIIRNTDHDPTSPSDGQVVYNGTGFFYTDTPIEYGISQFYRAWSWANPFSDNSTNASILVAPAPPYNGNSVFHAGTQTVNFTWHRGNGSMQELVLEKSTGYSTTYTDGALHQNGTQLYYNVTVNSSSGYFSIWSYNHTQKYYSWTGLNIPWGAIGVNCYNETNPSQAIDFNLEISNYEGTQVYQQNGLTNTQYIDVNELPYGTNTIFIVSNSSYKQRVYYKDIRLNQFANYSFYLPPLSVSGGGSGGGGGGIPPNETVDTSLYYIRIVETIEKEYTEVDRAVEGAMVNIQRYINTTGVYTNVSQLLTDANGYVNVYLIPGNNYKVRITKDGYETKIADYIPQPPNIYGQTTEKWFRITNTSDEDLTDLDPDHLFTNIEWSILPNIQRWNTSFTVWFNITSSDDQLLWYSMEVLFYNYSSWSWTTLSYQNFTNASGGSINYTLPNVPGKYSVRCWFQKDGYAPYELAQEGSLEYFIVSLKEWMDDVPDFAYYIVVLIIMIILMGFFYKYLNTGILTGYIGLTIMALALLLKHFEIDGVSGWVIWGISMVMYTIGIFLWSRI